MKNLIKIVAAFTGLLALLFQFNVLQPQEEAMACGGGCLGEAKSTEFRQCDWDDCQSYVIRCEYGSGFCSPSSQGFCDEC